MKLKLIRDTFTNTTTIGKLFINGIFECFTLEDKDRHLELHPADKVNHLSAIPRGTYKIEPRFSPHFGCITPHLIDVNGFVYVLMHWGNYSKDTDGCILVGQTKGIDFIGHSKDEFAHLMNKLQVAFDAKEEVTIEVV